MKLYMESMLGMDSVIVRLLLAAVFGFIIGVNREHKRRGAGTRTHALVCMASCLVMLTSEYIALTFPDYNGDVARLSAQVISGMGFIGAGTIIVTRYNHVRGLTTAASLWTTACLGLAIGSGFLKAAIAAEAIIMFMLVTVEKIDHLMKAHSMVHDYLIVFEDINALSLFLNEIKAENIKINNIEINRSKVNEEIVMVVTLESKKDLAALLLTLKGKFGIRIMNEL